MCSGSEEWPTGEERCKALRPAPGPHRSTPCEAATGQGVGRGALVWKSRNSCRAGDIPSGSCSSRPRTSPAAPSDASRCSQAPRQGSPSPRCRSHLHDVLHAQPQLLSKPYWLKTQTEFPTARQGAQYPSSRSFEHVLRPVSFAKHTSNWGLWVERFCQWPSLFLWHAASSLSLPRAAQVPVVLRAQLRIPVSLIPCRRSLSSSAGRVRLLRRCSSAKSVLRTTAPAALLSSRSCKAIHSLQILQTALTLCATAHVLQERGREVDENLRQ